MIKSCIDTNRDMKPVVVNKVESESKVVVRAITNWIVVVVFM